MTDLATLKTQVHQRTAALNAACRKVLRTVDPFDKPAIGVAEKAQVLLTLAINGRAPTADKAVKAFRLLVEKAIDIADSKPCTVVWVNEPELNGRHSDEIGDIAYVVSCRGYLYAHG